MQMDADEDAVELRNLMTTQAHARARAHEATDSMTTPSDEAMAAPSAGERFDLGRGSIAWAPCHIGHSARIGEDVSIGCLAHIGRDVVLGDRCRVQGGAYIADRSIIGSDVFVGPNATLLNDRFPPSGNPFLWQPVMVEDGAVIGGAATLVAGVTVHAAAVIAAGAVVTRDVPASEVWAGMPAKRLMSRMEYDAKADRRQSTEERTEALREIRGGGRADG